MVKREEERVSARYGSDSSAAGGWRSVRRRGSEVVNEREEKEREKEI